MRGDRSGIIGVLDRLSRSHRVTRSKGAAGDVDRDNVGSVRALGRFNDGKTVRAVDSRGAVTIMGG